MTENKVALITGASYGIGKELAKVFAQNRYNLILVARSQEKLQALSQELTSRHGTSVKVMAKDLSDPSSAEEILSDLRQEKIPVETLVNNAAFGMSGPFAQEDSTRLMSMMQVNITTLTMLTRLLLPDMIQRGAGKVLNVASTAAFQPGPLMAVYYASKAYVLWLSEALSNELQGTGVTVSALCPGPTQTEFQKGAQMERSKLFRKKKMQADVVARAGFQGLIRGKRVIIPGLMNNFLSLLSQISPRTFSLRFIRWMNEPGR